MQLPRLERRVLPNVGPSVRVSERTPSTMDDLAEGFETAGAVGLQLAQDTKQKQDEDAISNASLTFSTKRNQWREEQRKRAEAAPLGAPGFADALLKDYDADVAQTIQGVPEGRARDYLTRQLQADFRGSLESSARNFETTARTKRITTEQDQAIDQSRVYVRNKPDAFDGTLAEHTRYLETTGLPADVRETLGIKARQSLAASAVETVVERDPHAALTALRSAPGESGNSAIEALSPESRERAINLADTEIRRRESEARARAAEARSYALAQSMALKDYMSDAQESFAMGFGLPKDYGDVRQAIGSLPDDDPRKGHLLRQDAVLSTLDNSGFMALNPSDQQAALTGLESRLQAGEASSVDLDMLKMARSVQAETERRANADPFQFAIQRGVVPLPASTGDPLADMKSRADAGRQASAFLGRDVPGFTGQELTVLGENFLKGSVDERLGMVAGIVESHGQAQASTVFEALDKKNFAGMGLVGALVTDDPEAARLVVKGQKAMQEGEGKALVPKSQDMTDALLPLLGDAYGLGTGARATVEQGVREAYAALSVDAGDASGDLDEGRLTQAVQAVTGGLITHQGRTMPAPKRGVTQSQFNGWAEALQPDDFKGVAGLEPSRALDVFRRDGWLEAIGPNQYAPVIMGPDGRGRYLVDGKGQPFTLAYDGGKVRSIGSRVSEAFSLPRLQ